MNFHYRSRTLISSVCVGLLSIWLGALPSIDGAWADQRSDKQQDIQAVKLDQKIAGLIEKLGASQYAARERAQAELERLGLAAFDALHDAQSHDDIEIAMRARYLVLSMRVNWSRESDSPDVKRILRGYGDRNSAERKNRMEQLSLLEDGLGVEALCRLIRFEPEDRLSKYAALLVMNSRKTQEEDQRLALSERIRKTIGLSKRVGAQWLAAYAKTLEDPLAALELWESIIDKQIRSWSNSPEKNDRETTRDLIRWHAVYLLDLDRNEDALAVMRKTIDLIDGTREQLIDTVDWLMQHNAWLIVEEVSRRYPDKFDEYAILVYRLAEAQLQQGSPAAAEATAQRALNMNPEQSQDHIVAAYSLQERGLFEWSEREYRHVLEKEGDGSIHDLRARFLLSEMQHDQQQDKMAADVLKVAVDAMDNDPAIVQTVQQRLGRNPGSIRSRMHYFYARHFDTLEDRKSQQRHLEDGVKSDPTDADVLIGMFRFPGADAEWKEKTQGHIQKAAAQFRQQIKGYQEQVTQSKNEPLREYANRQLASANNQLAWLIGNTDGDFDEAVRCSHKSLELRPEAAGFLDTLGRCYYAKGDYKNAVKYQSQAVELDPFSGQIQRQLTLFQEALKKSQAGGATTKESP